MTTGVATTSRTISTLTATTIGATRTAEPTTGIGTTKITAATKATATARATRSPITATIRATQTAGVGATPKDGQSLHGSHDRRGHQYYHDRQVLQGRRDEREYRGI